MSKLKTIISNLSQSSSKKLIYCSTFDSPLGKIIASADDDSLHVVVFEDSKNLEKIFGQLSTELSCQFVEEKNKILSKFGEELAEYFEGKLKKFNVSTKPFGSEFQKAVWNQLQELPYGSTDTYGGLAKSLGHSTSYSRAVGSACGANPLILVVPCHRLVASTSAGGFAAGMDRKHKLLELERNYSSAA